MEPDAIGHVSRELRIIAREPIRQVVQGVRVSRQVGRGTGRRLGVHHQARARLDHLRSAGEKHDFVAGDLVLVELVLLIIVRSLARKVGEIGGQVIIVVLRPNVEGVIVAAGALKTDAEKHLRDRFGRRRGVAIGSIKTRGGIAPGGTARGQDFAGELVKRRASGDLIAKPALKDPSSLVPHRLFFVAEQVGPFQRPVIGELRPIQEAIDQFRSLRRIGIGDERTRLVDGRQDADRIKIGSSYKYRIA